MFFSRALTSGRIWPGLGWFWAGLACQWNFILTWQTGPEAGNQKPGTGNQKPETRQLENWKAGNWKLENKKTGKLENRKQEPLVSP